MIRRERSELMYPQSHTAGWMWLKSNLFGDGIARCWVRGGDDSVMYPPGQDERIGRSINPPSTRYISDGPLVVLAVVPLADERRVSGVLGRGMASDALIPAWAGPTTSVRLSTASPATAAVTTRPGMVSILACAVAAPFPIAATGSGTIGARTDRPDIRRPRALGAG